MILVGIDDTDTLETRGTNHLARTLVARIAERWPCRRVLRHQLLVDPRIPYTSHNGSASLAFDTAPEADAAELRAALREGMLAEFIEGSDPGLCVATRVAPAVAAFAERCRREVVTADEARAIAEESGVSLEGLGGTEGGVIGALAAVGLAASGDHGRVVFDTAWHVIVGGVVGCDELRALGVEAILDAATGDDVAAERIDVGKKLRPNRRGGRTVLLVEPGEPGIWRALRAD